MKKIILLVFFLIVLSLLNLFFGSVDIPAKEVLSVLTGGEASKDSWTYIVRESRLPQTITALFCGASLAASGLMLQTSFRNPLAGPSILGITNGASLGVAIVMLASGGVMGASVLGTEIHIAGVVAVIMAAFLGALVIMAILLSLSTVVKDNLMLLIVGIQIVKRKSVVACEEIDRSIMSSDLGNIKVRRSHHPLGRVAGFTGISFKERSHIIPVASVPFRPSVP